jgi:hypothetical protein
MLKWILIIGEASRHFRNKKKEYLKDRIIELATRTLETFIQE